MAVEIEVGDQVEVTNRKSWLGYRATVLEILADGKKVLVQCGEHLNKKGEWVRDQYYGSQTKLPLDILVPIFDRESDENLEIVELVDDQP